MPLYDQTALGKRSEGCEVCASCIKETHTINLGGLSMTAGNNESALTRRKKKRSLILKQ